MVSDGRRRGIILFVALVVAVLMMMWAVAATCRANFESSATLFSYRRSKAYYLAKTAISRSLDEINTNAGWLSAHTGRNNADTTTTTGAACWIDSNGPDMVLRCQATVDTETARLNVPLLKRTGSDTHIYSIAPSVGGPDLIAWCTINTNTWHALPPIPSEPTIAGVTSTVDGDVYAIAKGSGGTSLWRYRTGQGWLQMPDTPDGMQLSSLSAQGDKRLICLGTNQSGTAMLIFPLQTSLNWTLVSPPTGTTGLTHVAAQQLTAQTADDMAYATATLVGAGPAVYKYDLQTDAWTSIGAPTAYSFFSTNGAQAASGGTPSNFSGGLAIDTSGDVYVATNPTQPGRASVIYRYEAGSWQSPPHPVPYAQWQSGGTLSGTGYVTSISDLSADDQGNLWLQCSGGGSAYSIIEVTPPRSSVAPSSSATSN